MLTCSGAQMPQEKSKKPPSQLPEGLSTTYEDLLLSSLSHCILPVKLNLAIFWIQHKALVLFLFFSPITLGFTYEVVTVVFTFWFQKVRGGNPS